MIEALDPAVNNMDPGPVKWKRQRKTESHRKSMLFKCAQSHGEAFKAAALPLELLLLLPQASAGAVVSAPPALTLTQAFPAGTWP